MYLTKLISLKNFTGIILVCFADTPFLTPETIEKIVKSFNNDTKLVITGFKKHETFGIRFKKLFRTSGFHQIPQNLILFRSRPLGALHKFLIKGCNVNCRKNNDFCGFSRHPPPGTLTQGALLHMPQR